MNEDAINTIINAGTGAILLFLYVRLETRFDALQKQLHETNLRMWQLLEKLATSDALTDSQIRPYNPPPTPPS